MEIWDIYDKNRALTGKTVKRGTELTDGEYHVVVHVCIFSPNGKLLIQQRQNFNGGWPNMWDFSTAGSAVAGETSIQAAVREVQEELGVDIYNEMKELRPTFTINFEHGFDDFYIINCDLQLEALHLQPDEVQNASFADRETVFSMIDNNEFIPYHKSLAALVFDYNEYSSAYSL